MRRVREGTIGIVPAGALGVSFFYHLTRELTKNDGSVFFLERTGSHSAQALREKGVMNVEVGNEVRRLPVAQLFRGDLLSAFDERGLPEVLLLCPNPNQLPAILNSIVELLERMNDAGELAQMDLPVFVLCSNGIYYQRLRQQFIERLEEATHCAKKEGVTAVDDRV